jgi:SAM-dependent methyltransferase
MTEPERLRELAARMPPLAARLGASVLRTASATRAAMTYVGDWRAYRRLPCAEPLRLRDAFPQLGDRIASSPFDRHYLYQDVWAAQAIAALAPARHVDVGSRIDYVGFLTALCHVTFIDIRPLEAAVNRLHSIRGSILDLPLADRSVHSLSCLHVAEHIGLGRYGDPLDPLGTRRAAAELQRVLAPGGQLLFSLPVGRSRVCFNAHRIHHPQDVLRMFDELQLTEFSGIDDAGAFRRGRPVSELARSRYACGLFRFTRPG